MPIKARGFVSGVVCSALGSYHLDMRLEKRRGIFLLPNLFTTGALFCGFYAAIAAIDMRFNDAVIALFVSMLLDFMDGRVARWTNTESSFGASYDSLSDVISFGMAPAILTYQWGLSSLGKLGFAISFLVAATAALRLARFNTQAGNQNKRYFQGLPSPAAAGLIASMVYAGDSFAAPVSAIVIPIAVMTSLLMVSNVRYLSFKEFNFKKRIPFVGLVLVALIFLSLSIHPPWLLFLIFLGYAISGSIWTLIAMQKRRLQRQNREQKNTGHIKDYLKNKK